MRTARLSALVLLALAGVATWAGAIRVDSSRPRDPHGILSAAGLSLAQLDSAHCFPTGERAWRAAFGRARTCRWPRPDEVRAWVPARLPTREASARLDAFGRTEGAMRRWRDDARANQVRRDSVGAALTATGASHLLCADSVDVVSAASPIWASRWQSAEYSAVLFHYVQRDSVTLQLQVGRPGSYGRCREMSATER